MQSGLRLGVIGLGRRWHRYRSAMAAMGKSVHIRAVFDPVANRAAEEAGRSGCLAVGGVIELVERDDIDAVVVTSGGWMGLWPLMQAALAGKPAYCAVSPVVDEDRIDALRAAVPGADIHLAAWPNLRLLVRAFEDRVVEAIGPPDLIQATWAGDLGADPLRSPAALALLDECGRLMGLWPQAITASTVHDRPDMVGLTVEFGDGNVANLLLYSSATPHCRLTLHAGPGTASLSLPGRLSWRNAEGRFDYRLPRGMAELASLEEFSTAVEEESFADLDSLFCSLDWLRAARVSRKEGRRVVLRQTPPTGVD